MGKKTIPNLFPGDKFNKLTLISLFRKNISKKQGTHYVSYWKCKCDCGNDVEVAERRLYNNHTKSCGCINAAKGKHHFNYKGTTDIYLSYFYSLSQGAKTRNLEFNITIEYINQLLINQNFKCALSGLDISTEWKVNHTASLDRIDNTKGYIVGNLQWIYKDINIMKMDLTEEKFLNYCLLVCKNKGLV